MEPTVKSEGMEKSLTKIFGFDRREKILANMCVPKPIGCGSEVVGFRDQLSAREYTISGLCQFCQDKVFGGKEKRGKLPIPAPKRPGLQQDGSFFQGGHMPMRSASHEASKFTYRKVIGNDGDVWLYPVNTVSPAEQVHVHNPRKAEEAHNHGGFEGYGGSTLRFELEDGTNYDAKGPWHTNADALFAATGVDIRNTHYTFGCVALRRTGSLYDTTFEDVLYADREPVLGPFDRLKKIAVEYATRLGHPVFCYSQSAGGSSSGQELPEGTKWQDWQDWLREQNTKQA